MEKNFTGWKKYGEFEICMENGKVIMLMDKKGNTQYPYRRNRKMGGYDNIVGCLTWDALRAAERRESIAWY